METYALEPNQTAHRSIKEMSLRNTQAVILVSGLLFELKCHND